MRPTSDDTLAKDFSIYRASHGALKAIDLALPHNALVSISGNGPVGKTSLVARIVHGYSKWLLHQVQFGARYRGRVPLVERASGVLPSRLVNELYEQLPPSASVGEFLGLNSLLDIAANRVARPSCMRPDCLMEDRSFAKTAPEILAAVTSGSFERPITVIGAQISVEKSQLSEALAHYIAEGYKRFLCGGRMFRSANTAEIGALEGGELSIICETLSAHDTTPLRLAEAVQAARTLGGGAVVALVSTAASFRFDGSPLDETVRQWSIFDGFGCDRCGKRFLRATNSSEPVTLKIADQSIDRLSSLTINRIHELFAAEVDRLAEATPSAVLLLVERLNALRELSLGELTPAERLGALAPASRYLIVLAKPAPAGLLQVLDCPERILGSDAITLLAPWCEQRLREGDSILFASNAPELVALASLRLSLKRTGDDSIQLVSNELSIRSEYAYSVPQSSSPRRSRQFKFQSRHFAATEIAIAIGALSLLECAPFVPRQMLCDELATHAKAAGFRAIHRISPDMLRAKSAQMSELRLSDLWQLAAPLAELYANSRAARVAGLRADDFNRRGAGACDLCRGSGVNSIALDLIGQLEQPCRRCGGSGFDAKVSEIVVAGTTIAEASTLTLASLRATLPLERALLHRLEIAEQLSLGTLPLNRLCSELAESERSLLVLAAALASNQRKGRLLLLDGIFESLSDEQLMRAESSCLSFCRSGASVAILSVGELPLQALRTRISVAHQ